MTYEQELEEQLARDRAFKRINRAQRITFLTQPLVVKNGQRFRVATQTVADENGVVSQKRLVRV